MAFFVRNKTASQLIISDLGQFIEPNEELDLQKLWDLDKITRSVNSSDIGSIGNLISSGSLAIITELGGGGTEIDPQESVQVLGLTQYERDALDNVANALNSSNPPADTTTVNNGLAGKANLIHTHIASDVTDFNSAADARITAQKGVNNGIAELDGSGKIPTSQVPAIAVSDTYVEASESAMLALTAQTGDICVRTDNSKSYILKGTDPSILSHWQELLGAGGGSGVTSVNGDAGPIVTLDTDDINEGSINLYHTNSRVDARISIKLLNDL